RGVGFGIITVTGSAAVATLVPPARHGAAIGAYGVAVAGPQLLLLPAGPWLADAIGFWLVFAIGTLPVLAITATPRLARVLREHERTHSSVGEALSPEAAGQHDQAGGLREGRLGYLARALVPPMVIL